MIYFIRSGDFVKIGVSDNPRGRIAAIQTSNPNPIEVLGIVPGSYELEAELHQRFAHLRHKNEWFRDTKPIRQTIDDLRLIMACRDTLNIAVSNEAAQ